MFSGEQEIADNYYAHFSPDSKDLKTGELKGRVFGTYATVSQNTKLLCVENERGKIAIYDLDSMEKRDELSFPNRISLMRFSQDGRRLFVLTRDQTVYILDVSGHSKI